MRASWKVGITGAVFAYFAACAPVKFESIPTNSKTGGPPGVTPTAADICPRVCTGNSCVLKCKIERAVGEGLVDILIVNDNSGSMSKIQKNMANKFPTFIQSLGSLDWRLAMTTTDISSTYSTTPIGIRNDPGPYNGNGALQDGNLIPFSGADYLSRSTPNKESLFSSAISRQETIDCESSGYRNCPSDDERGVFAANLVLERTASKFMRPLAHLAVIILANEDERGLSRAQTIPQANDDAIIAMYPQEELDKPDTFIAKFKAKYPEKTLSVHSMIVKPGDTACQQQLSQPLAKIRAKEGFVYAELSQKTGGKIGSICDSDYGTTLTNIGYQLQGASQSFPFACRPINDQYSLYINGNLDTTTPRTVDVNKLELQITTQLPPLTQVRLEWDCPAQ